MVLDSKANLRKMIRQSEQSVIDVHSLQKIILSWELFSEVSKVAFYMPMKDEASLEFLFDTGKSLFLPRFIESTGTYEMARVEDSGQLESGKYGIKEPGQSCLRADKNEIELWFIPGMAFSRQGERLGRGAGFYDRLLAEESGLKAGICSSVNLLDSIPLEEHDITMDFVLTDKEIIKIQ